MVTSLARNPLVETIRDTIANEISRRRYRVGDKLPGERQYAESLGVSRGAFREAIRMLESEGLVAVRHGIGIEVTNNTGKPVSQTIERLLPQEVHRLRQSAEARLIIEPELAALAAEHGTKKEVEELLNLTEKLAAASSIEEAIEADLDFHHRIAEMSRNQILQMLLQSLADLGKQSRMLTLENFGFEKAARHHLKITEGIRKGDVTQARSSMRHHVQQAVDDLSVSSHHPRTRD
jgi:GntR family transcriptional regulator, transcriptional repressor for pyruvate dehydrogenase complex